MPKTICTMKMWYSVASTNENSGKRQANQTRNIISTNATEWRPLSVQPNYMIYVSLVVVVGCCVPFGLPLSSWIYDFDVVLYDWRQNNNNNNNSVTITAKKKQREKMREREKHMEWIWMGAYGIRTMDIKYSGGIRISSSLLFVCITFSS